MMPDGITGARKRLLIEEWLPAAAIGVECIRERSTGQQPPDKRFHVWWARRPLAASRAAVLASVLPADFPRDVFERLMGFWGPSAYVVAAEEMLIAARATGKKIANPHGKRAFRAPLREADIKAAHDAATHLWGHLPTVIDPMAGGGSIPLESARLGFPTMANEYNPVACSVLEATLDYPFRLGPALAQKARKWGVVWRTRFNDKVERFFPAANDPTYGRTPPLCYIFARTVPCPTTGHATPLVPDWHLLKPKGGIPVVAERLGVMAAERASLILDLGGGDRVLQEYGRDLQISEFCEAIGVKPLALYFTGPEPGDLDNVIATWKAGYFTPERSILVLNEYLVPQNRTVSGAFGPVLDHPAITEMAEAGLRIVVMTRLPCLQEMRQAGLSFGDVAAGRAGNNGKPLDPVRQFMVTTWMRRMEEGFAKRGATEWLP